MPDDRASDKIEKRKAVNDQKADNKAATWDKNIGSDSWTDSRHKEMLHNEWYLKKRSTENAYLYNAKGKRIFVRRGERAHVRFSDADIKKMNGGVLTHNHPGNDYGCFSPHDINMVRYGKLAELRCVTVDGIFRIQHPTKWDQKIGSLAKLESEYDLISAKTETAFFNRARMGEITYIDAENLGQRATVEELCRKYNIPFEYRTWDELRGEIDGNIF